MKNTNTPAARIRNNLKAAGIPAKAVSVRTRSTGSVDVVVNSLDVDYRKVKEIAQSEESIRRCEYTGEILSGGNTYVFIQLGDEAIDLAMAEVVQKTPTLYVFRDCEIYHERGDFEAYRLTSESCRRICGTYSLRYAVAACLGA